MSLSLIDIGANLTHDSFADDLPDVLARAEAAGVQRMVVTGSSDQGNIDAAELADAHRGRLFATAGVHPHHAAEYTDASDDTWYRSVSSKLASRCCASYWTDDTF